MKDYIQDNYTTNIFQPQNNDIAVMLLTKTKIAKFRHNYVQQSRTYNFTMILINKNIHVFKQN